MEQDNGRSLRDGLSPSVEPASSLDGSATSIPSAGEIARQAAECINTELFKPAIREAVESLYDELYGSVEAHLIENAAFNIAQRITMAEGQGKFWRDRAVSLATAVERAGVTDEGVLAALSSIRVFHPWPASGIAARSDETRSGSAEGKSPVA